MKPISPHDPLDDLFAAAVHGELSPAQRAEFESLVQNDPAARAAYQEILNMHDLLDGNFREAKPDPAFEERMISGVRRKARAETEHRETAWESLVVVWRAVKWPFAARPGWTSATIGATCVAILLGFLYMGQQVRGVFSTINSQLQLAQSAGSVESLTAAAQQLTPDTTVDLAKIRETRNTWASQPGNQQNFEEAHKQVAVTWSEKAPSNSIDQLQEPTASTKSGEQRTEEAIRVFPTPQFPQVTTQNGMTTTNDVVREYPQSKSVAGAVTGGLANAAPTTSGFSGFIQYGSPINTAAGDDSSSLDAPAFKRRDVGVRRADASDSNAVIARSLRLRDGADPDATMKDKSEAARMPTPTSAPAFAVKSAPVANQPADKPGAAGSLPVTNAAPAAAPEPSRKLVRDAQLDLEVKSFQKTVDAVTALAKAGGGYLDNSDSQRGGNGKLQGTVVVKVLPENLDAFLLKLRDLGEIKNQSVSTQDVTKDYYDMQARLDNSRRMESQLQLLLQHTNGKVSDLLEVERELGRVRGEIEQAQGQLKLYDFQVQYATVTISVAEKDLNQAAAYLLRETDNFSLFTRNVEDAFAQAKAAADAFKAEILNADLQHDSGNRISATLAFSVPPDQIDGFLGRVRSLGRVENFTRQTQRVANDGGDASQPADEARTDKDRVQVRLAIGADDESPRQTTQLAVASAGDIDAQAQQLKDDAVKSGAAVTGSNFERAPDGTETAAITFRLALSKVADFMPVLEKLGRVESLTVQRNDRPDQAAADPTAPAEIDLRLRNIPPIRFEDEPPRQQTELAIVSTGDVDAQAQEVKSDALKAGVIVTASTFQRAPDGTEQAAMTFRLPLTKAADFTAKLEKLGRVESHAVQRNDVTGTNSTDPNAPAEITFNLRNEPAFVAEDRGFWATLRHTFGGGIAAFLGSIETIGVLVAFVLPWVVAAGAVAWVARRIYVARRGRQGAV